MRAAFIHTPGPADSIVYGDLPVPPVGAGEVQVSLAAVAVNHIDTYIRSGALPQPLPTPFVIGRDMTGIVTAVGADVEAFQPGQWVWSNLLGYGGLQGSFAELLTVPADRLFHLPYGVDPVQAVALLHSGLTAAVGLVARAALRSGETVFVSGGSGSVGTAVLQIAKTLGARVAVTAGSAAKQARCRKLGADAVIDYHQPDVAAAVREFAPDGVNIYWEATGQFDCDRALSLLAPGGRIVLMAGLDRVCPLPAGKFYTHNATLYGFTVTGTPLEESRRMNQMLEGWLANSALEAQIQQVLPLSAAAAAHRRQEQEQLDGKLVLVPQP